jgi:hypothetical protein
MYAKDLKIPPARQEAYLLTQLVTKTITIKGFFQNPVSAYSRQAIEILVPEAGFEPAQS